MRETETNLGLSSIFCVNRQPPVVLGDSCVVFVWHDTSSLVLSLLVEWHPPPVYNWLAPDPLIKAERLLTLISSDSLPQIVLFFFNSYS